jgi:hypothetical protein
MPCFYSSNLGIFRPLNTFRRRCVPDELGLTFCSACAKLQQIWSVGDDARARQLRPAHCPMPCPMPQAEHCSVDMANAKGPTYIRQVYGLDHRNTQ